MMHKKTNLFCSIGKYNFKVINDMILTTNLKEDYMKYQKLFQKGKIGKLELKNRIEIGRAHV